jgi:hypothetical protein
MPGSRVKVVVEPRPLGRSRGTGNANKSDVLKTPNQNNDGEITGAEINTVHQRKHGGRHGGFRR